MQLGRPFDCSNLAACMIGEVIDDVVGRFPRLDDDQFADLVSRLRPPVES